MSTTNKAEDTTWWAEDRSIPFDDDVELEATAITVRGQGGQVAAPRSEYAELAGLATSMGPRDTATMLREARRVGELLGSRAYYDFPAGQGRVTGPSIDLMDALATVWGRLVSRVEVLEETNNRVHLRGRVVDLLALTAVERDYLSVLSPAPGKFAKDPAQADRWKVMQLQSASSKAIRGALEHALPAWLVDPALDAARQSAARQATGGKPLPEARQAAVQHLGKLGLDRVTTEAWLGQPLDLWTADELGQLRELARRLTSGEEAVEAVRAAAALRMSQAAQQPAAGGRLDGLGLKPSTPAATKPSSPPSPPAPPPSLGAASGGDQGPEPIEGVPARAAALHAAIRDRLPMSVEDAKGAMREACHMKQLRESAWAEVSRLGSAKGWWRISDGSLFPPTARVVEQKPEPKAEPQPSDLDVTAMIGDLERSLTEEQVIAAATEAGLPLDAEGYSDEEAAAYLAALERQAVAGE